MRSIFQIAKKIRSARREGGFSQQDLAEKIGISDKTISAYESGRAVPPLPTLSELAKITNKSINYFLESKNTKSKDEEVIKELKKISSLLEALVKNGKK